jgi:hypothetical protein
MIKQQGESELAGTQLLLLQKVHDLENSLRVSQQRCQELETALLEHHRSFVPPPTFLPKTVYASMSSEIAILNDYALLYRHQILKSAASVSKQLRIQLQARENDKEVEALRKRVVELSTLVHRLQDVEFPSHSL